METWNPWHGCRKISLGCLNCYVYRRHVEFGKDSIIIARISSFDLPVKAGVIRAEDLGFTSDMRNESLSGRRTAPGSLLCCKEDRYLDERCVTGIYSEERESNARYRTDQFPIRWEVSICEKNII